MRTFLINLARDVGRLSDVTKRLSEQGIPFERMDAVYGKDLPEGVKRQSVCRWRWRLAMGREVFDGEIGCALSHFGIYRRMIREQIPVACIFEDDVVFVEKDGAARLREIEEFVDVNRRQVVLLSDHGTYEKPGHVIKRVRFGIAADSYVITLPAARAVLQLNCPMKVPCDHWSRWAKQGGVELYRSYPVLTNQAWDVHPSHIKPAKRKNPLWTRVLRHLGYVFDRALLWFERYRDYVFVYLGGGDTRFSKSANAYQKRKLVAENLKGVFLAKKGVKTWPEFEFVMRTKLPRYVKPIYCDNPSGEAGFIKTILQRVFLWRRPVLFCWDPPGIFWRDRKDRLARFRCWVLNQLQSMAILCSRVTIFNLHPGFAEANLWRCCLKRCEFFLNGVCLEERLRAVEGIAHVPHRLAINNAFMRGKGCFFVAEVLAKLKARLPDLSIAWVGADCGDLDAVRERLQTAGFGFARDVVHFGPAGFDEAAKVLATASVALNAYPDVPSLRWNYVLKIPEFLAYGLRVVSADLPGSAAYGTETFRAGDVDDAVAKLVAAFNSSSMPLETEKASKHLNLQTSKPLSLSSLSQWDWQAINHLIAEKVRKF